VSTGGATGVRAKTEGGSSRWKNVKGDVLLELIDLFLAKF